MTEPVGVVTQRLQGGYVQRATSQGVAIPRLSLGGGGGGGGGGGLRPPSAPMHKLKLALHRRTLL